MPMPTWLGVHLDVLDQRAGSFRLQRQATMPSLRE